MNKLKEIFTSWRIIILIIFVIMAIVAINPKLDTSGALIKTIDKNSSAEANGLTTGEIILEINNEKVLSTQDYSSKISSLAPNEITKIKTNKAEYSILIEDYNGTIYTGIQVGEVPTSNLRKGLDLAGGVRILLQPEETITEQQTQDIITITKKRLNVYGLSDINVREVKDLEGNIYILTEIAGANKEEVINLLEKQGKFEAKIGNDTVFHGGTDIKYVCRSGDCSGIRSCDQFEDGWACRFQFQVDVSPESAKTHAEVTGKLGTILEGNERYLDKKLDLYLDNALVDSLFISENLKGQELTSFVIQGSGTGRTREEAINNGLTNMKKLQTVLITGSLPVKLNIAKLDIISPKLGEEFFKSAIMAIIVAILAVASVIFIRYRKLKIALPVILTGLSEIIIIFGVASLIKWNLDLAAIAGILAAVGTGVDSQIVITDEILRGETAFGSWKEKIKKAFFIIMAAYFTTVVALAPLWMMGAGLLKGFAITTTIGVTIGVFLTRPAYAKIIEILLK